MISLKASILKALDSTRMLTAPQISSMSPYLYEEVVVGIHELLEEGTIIQVDTGKKYNRYKVVTDEFDPREPGENHGT